MEASHTNAAERLALFLDRVAEFLDALALTDSVGTEQERSALGLAVGELRAVQLPRAKDDLRAAGAELDIAGFSERQLSFKLAVAERAMEEATAATPTRWLPPSAIWKAVGKLTVVLGSIKSLSKWLEAVDELVGMAGELAKNRLNPRFD